jgi:two-component system response regulator HydG
MAKHPGKILIIDDNTDLLIAARLLLKSHYQVVQTGSDPDKIPVLLARDSYDVILLDMNFSLDVSSGHEGFHYLDKILSLEPQAVVILITAYGDENTAVKAIHAGAVDFVLKPWHNEKLLATIASAMSLRSSREEVSQLKRSRKQLNAELNKVAQPFIGQSAAVKALFSLINRAAATDANILITGESGTGKELVAREIHRQSLRVDNAFISVDMGAISDNLFESELFGHKKGAFTDARDDRMGRFELADQGSLFLDELGNLPLPLQSKLLTVVQQRQITPVGGNKAIDINIRLICATNENLTQRVAQQLFRQDLLYRVNTVELHLPPLRERKSDIPLLVEYFLDLYGKKYKRQPLSVADVCMAALCDYAWPGNIRELQHAMERAVILSVDNQLSLSQLNLTPTQISHNNHSDESIADVRLPSLNLAELELFSIKAALDKHDYNISHAAKELGLTRTSLYRRMEKHDL